MKQIRISNFEVRNWRGTIFITALALALLALALGAEAQGPGKVYRIGILTTQVNGGAPCEPRSPSGC
jgi:hypothetical protein